MMVRLLWVSVVLMAGASAAQEMKVEGASADGSAGATPQRFALEFRLGSFTPLIDREAALQGNKPYEKSFGVGAAMLLGELELSYQFFKAFGSLGVGISGGYAEKYGKAVGADGEPTSENTALQLVPMRALLVYRFDVLATRFRVPLVPYAKLGFAATYFWNTKGNVLEKYDTVGRGLRLGIAGQFGLMLQLDFLDQRLAHDFDVDVGVNHSYLFGEWNIQEVNNFGTGGLDLSSRHWMFGLAFEL